MYFCCFAYLHISHKTVIRMSLENSLLGFYKFWSSLNMCFCFRVRLVDCGRIESSIYKLGKLKILVKAQ